MKDWKKSLAMWTKKQKEFNPSHTNGKQTRPLTRSQTAQLSIEEKIQVARVVANKLNQSTGPCAFIMPLAGIDEWDKLDGPFHDPEGLQAFAETIKHSLGDAVELHEIDAHINDQRFAGKRSG